MMSGSIRGATEANTRLTIKCEAVDQIDNETKNSSRVDVNDIGITTLKQEKSFSNFNFAEKHVKQKANETSLCNKENMLSGSVRGANEANTLLTSKCEEVDQIDDETKDCSPVDVDDIMMLNLKKSFFNFGEKHFGQKANETSLKPSSNLISILDKFLDQKLSRDDYLNELWYSNDEYCQCFCVMALIRALIKNRADQRLQHIHKVIDSKFKNDDDFGLMKMSILLANDRHKGDFIKFNCSTWDTDLNEIIPFFNIIKNIFEELDVKFVFDVKFPKLPSSVNNESVMERLKKEFPFKYSFY
jgi:hypothetical protein